MDLVNQLQDIVDRVFEKDLCPFLLLRDLDRLDIV
jgi:hypothetical protein